MESQNVEYKLFWKDDYLKWICGFANAQGGTIYIGIDDNGSPGTQERRQVAEGLALVANKHTMAAGEQRAVGTEGGQGENRFGCLLHRSRLGIQGMNHSELPHEERELEGDEYDDSFHE